MKHIFDMTHSATQSQGGWSREGRDYVEDGGWNSASGSFHSVCLTQEALCDHKDERDGVCPSPEPGSDATWLVICQICHPWIFQVLFTKARTLFSQEWRWPAQCGLRSSYGLGGMLWTGNGPGYRHVPFPLNERQTLSLAGWLTSRSPCLHKALGVPGTPGSA